MVAGRGVVLLNMIWRWRVTFTDRPTSAGIQSDAFAPAKSATDIESDHALVSVQFSRAQFRL
jgi:hypothetical protein